MSQAEKLMYELSHNCGIDFNNTRRALAVEIIEKAFGEVGKEPVMPVMRQIVEPSPGGTFASVDPLAAIPSVADAIEVQPLNQVDFGQKWMPPTSVEHFSFEVGEKAPAAIVSFIKASQPSVFGGSSGNDNSEPQESVDVPSGK